MILFNMGILVEEVKPGLQRILEEGFVDTGRRFSYLYMLERGNDAILYDPKKDKVDLRYRVGEDGRARLVF